MMLCYMELSASLESYMEQERQGCVHSTAEVTLRNVKLILGLSGFKKTTAIPLLGAISKLTLFTQAPAFCHNAVLFSPVPLFPRFSYPQTLGAHTMVKESQAGF